MKEKDIENYTISETCFGKYISINDTDVEDIPEEELVELVMDSLKNNPNKRTLLDYFIGHIVEYSDNLEYQEAKDLGWCEQCGSANYETIYKRVNENI
jgi:cephalosporin hydroxylase